RRLQPLDRGSPAGRSGHRPGRAVLLHEGGPQVVVPGHERLDGGGERVAVEPAAQTPYEVHRVRGVSGLQPLEHPEPLLHRRQRRFHEPAAKSSNSPWRSSSLRPSSSSRRAAMSVRLSSASPSSSSWAANPAIVEYSNRATIGTSRPYLACTLAMIWIAAIEWPPSSKKSSSAPMGSVTSSTSAQISASSDSTPAAGAV